MRFLSEHIECIAAVILCLPLLASCAVTKNAGSAPSMPAESVVDKSLRDAGEAITYDLAILTGSSQNRDFGQPQSSGDIYSKMTLEYSGPLEGALAKLASGIGYKLEVEGKVPVTPVIVHVKQIDRPALTILRDVGMQTSQKEGVELNEELRLIRLIYVDGGKKK